MPVAFYSPTKGATSAHSQEASRSAAFSAARNRREDLLAQLAPAIHDPLRRGDELSNGAARGFGLDEFVRAVAERESVDPAQAREHVRAVLATLREAVTPTEFYDMTSQLPDEFTAVLARP